MILAGLLSLPAMVSAGTDIPDVITVKKMSMELAAQIAEEKANAVILGSVSSGEIRNNRQDIRQELNHVNGILIMQGGLPIRAAGSILGAVGVSGAPGGDKDEACAQKALDSVQERLDFTE